MKDKRFDDIVRSKLSDLKSDSTPKWNQFLEKKKTADSVEADMYFDKNVRNKIAKHRIEFNADHWILLKARLNYLASIRRKVNGLKLMELSALFILLFIMHSNLDQKVLLSPNDQMVDLNRPFEESINLVNTYQTDLISKKIINSSTKVASEIANAVKENIASIDIDITNKSVPNKTLLGNQRKEQSQLFKDLFNAQSLKEKSSESNINNTILISEVNNSLTSLPNKELNNEIDLISSIEIINPKPLIEQIRLPFILREIGIKPLMRNSSWLHLTASFDNNMIFTPDDLAYNTTERRTEMFGFTFGVLYSRLIGKWELETGLTTSTYSKPWDFTQQYGNFNGWYKYSFTNIKNNFVGIPIQLKYHFVQNNEWSIFGKTGLTSEFVVNSEYTSDNQYLGGVPIGVGTNPDFEHPDAPFEEDHNFSMGLFQGGNINDNLFVRAQLGLGIERNITPKLSTYFSGEYHVSVINNDLGPNNDKINKFNFNVGIKMLIK